MRERYSVEWIPSEAVQAVYERHKSAIDNEGASVWDFTHPEDLTVGAEVADEKSALSVCKNVVRKDDNGEVRVDHEVLDPEDEHWRSTKFAHYYEGDTEFHWTHCD